MPPKLLLTWETEIIELHPPQLIFPSPLAGEGSGALANAVSLGAAGRGGAPCRRASPEAIGSKSFLRQDLALHHPPSPPSPARGEGADRRCCVAHARPPRLALTPAPPAGSWR